MRLPVRVFFLTMITALVLVSIAACGGGGSNSGSSSPQTSVLLYPSSPSVPTGQQVQFTAFIPSLSNPAFTWAVTTGSSNGTVSGTGLFTAMGACPASATVTVTSGAFSGSATVNITCAQAVTVAPAALAVPAGHVTTFTAKVNGIVVTPEWFVNGVQGGDTLFGTIDANGNYAAPSTPPPGGVAPITAISGGNAGTAAATVVFSNSSLAGPYTFSYTGSDGSFLTVAGSFTANGNGGIAAGVEDVASLHSGKSAQVAFTGTYNVNFDGSATITLSNGNVLQLSLTENTAAHAGQPVQHALLSRFGNGGSDTATGSGTLDQQNPGMFSVSAFSGNFAFGLTGVDSAASPLELVGKFNATGAGISIPAGFAEQDISYKGAKTSSSADTTLQGGYQMDPVFGTSNGRGVVTLTSTSTILNPAGTTTTFQFAFYIVDNTHMKIVETSDPAKFLLGGDFRSAPNDDGLFNTANSLPAGKYAFTWSGTASDGVYTGGGLFDSNGSGAINTGDLDVNNGGVQFLIDSLLAGSYSVDPNLGRITFSLFAGGNVLEFAGYTASNGSVFLLELDGSAQATGSAFLQSAATALQQGTYALNLSGLANTNNGPREQDILGQTSTLIGTELTGTISINNSAAASISVGEPVVPALSTILGPDTLGRGTLTITTANATFPLAYYEIDNNTVLLMATNSARVMTGTIARQF
jgi:hypothetical protein